jgi:hypothetical protein
MYEQDGIIELFRKPEVVGFYDRFLSFIENIENIENIDIIENNDNNNNDKYVENLVLSLCKKNDMLALFKKSFNLLIHEMASKIDNCRSYKYPLKLDISIFASYLFENNIDNLPFETAKTFFGFISEIISDINGEQRFENNLFMCKQITVIIVDIFKLLDAQCEKLNNLIRELYGDTSHCASNNNKNNSDNENDVSDGIPFIIHPVHNKKGENFAESGEVFSPFYSGSPNNIESCSELYSDVVHNDMIKNLDKEFIKRFFDFLKTLDEDTYNKNDVFEVLYNKCNYLNSFNNILKLVVDDISSQIKVNHDSKIPITLNFHKYTGAFENDIVPENFPVVFFEFIEEIVQKVNEKTTFQENFDVCGKIAILIGAMTNIVLAQRDATMELINGIVR